MRRFEFTIDGRAFAVDVESIGTSEATVVVNGVRHTVHLDDRLASPAAPALVAVPPAGHAAARARVVPAAAVDGAVRAPMPGLVLDVPVAVGDPVAAGAVVVRLEAMKMENELRAPFAGVVTEVHVARGADVPLGSVLVRIARSPD